MSYTMLVGHEEVTRDSALGMLGAAMAHAANAGWSGSLCAVVDVVTADAIESEIIEAGATAVTEDDAPSLDPRYGYFLMYRGVPVYTCQFNQLLWAGE